ncbi:MAG TPA: hypothetical protein VIM37_00910 [Candidatus Microsaccharimonas sp.]|jgi:hypothetical protein
MSIEYGSATADWNKIPTGRGESLEAKRGVENGSYELWQADIGDIIHVVAGEGDQQYIYDFEVIKAGSEPVVSLTQTGPDKSVVRVEGFEVVLRGSGSWVGREWPLFKYGHDRAGESKQILIDYGSLHVGGSMVLLDITPGRPIDDRIATLEPAITSIEIVTLEPQSEVEV